MTSTYKYIDISSTFRNRNLYPSPSNFVLNVSGSKNVSMNPLQSEDPIVKGVPSASGYTTAVSTPVMVTLSANASALNNFYTDDYVQLGSEYGLITLYDGTTKVAIISNSFVGIYPVGTPYNIRGQLPILTSSIGAFPLSTENLINLGPLASNINNTYTGMFIYFITGIAQGKVVQITNYNGATNIATLRKPLSDCGPPSFGDIYEILQFTENNSYPLIYPGTIGFSQPVGYAIELLYLIIPNVSIKSAYGGTFSNYPYLYVTLFNDGNMHTGQTLYSNNPAASKALFKIPIGLNLKQEIFFTLRDAKQIQVVKFVPDQALRFSINFPNGEPVIFETPDNLSPLAPNPFLQISATFAIRRLDGEIVGK